jgi:serine O-acetyltransferase
MGILFNKSISEDLYRYEGNRGTKLVVKLKYLFCVPGFTYIFFYRHASESRFVLFRFIWCVFLHLTKVITHIQIPYSTKIGRGFRIAHFGPIVINPYAIIGDNFNISQGCLVGSSRGKETEVPTIGNNVCMNANSIIIGNVIIGNDVLVAPGAFVNFDVPDNSIVIGNPGRIITRDKSPTAKHIVYPIVSQNRRLI